MPGRKTPQSSRSAVGLISDAALAQAPAARTTTAPATATMAPATTTTTTTTVTPAQETAIKTYVTKEKRTTVAAPSGFTVSTGAVLPESVEVYSLPSDVGVTGYKYSVIGGKTVLVDNSRKIVQTID